MVKFFRVISSASFFCMDMFLSGSLLNCLDHCSYSRESHMSLRRTTLFWNNFDKSSLSTLRFS